MTHPRLRSIVRGRGLLLLPAAALVVHQLRYSLAYGSNAGSMLAAQGHSYLNSLAPWLVLLLCLGASSFLLRVARAVLAGGDNRPRRSFAGLWALATGSLVAIYVVQELLESFFAVGHPAGFAGVFGHGGWWALVASLVAGAAVAGLLRVACEVVSLAGRSAPRSLVFGLPPRRLRRQAFSARSPVAACVRGRRAGAACRLVRQERPEKPLRKEKGRLVRARFVIVGCLVALALPAHAMAHGRAPAVALDFRLELDPAVRSIPGVSVRVLDGDRSLRLSVAGGHRVVVRGLLREPVLRIGPDGVWVNAGSPTAAADKLISKPGAGWVHVSGGNSIAWHDHRLAPPAASQPGPAGSFSVPISVDGRAAVITGTFWRVRSPSVWPWLGGTAALLIAIAAVAALRRGWRSYLTVGLGTAAGLGALVAITTFAARDAPNGRVAWLQIVAGVAVGAVLAVLLVVFHDRRRVHVAGVIGGIAAVATIGSLPVFWHGVVISALPPTPARLACGLALAGGVAAAALSFLPDFDDARRARR